MAEERDAEAAALFQKLPELVASDARLIWRGRFLSADLMIGTGAIPFLVNIAEGRVGSLEIGRASWRATV